jgi:hypothetical protein
VGAGRGVVRVQFYVGPASLSGMSRTDRFFLVAVLVTFALIGVGIILSVV